MTSAERRASSASCSPSSSPARSRPRCSVSTSGRGGGPRAGKVSGVRPRAGVAGRDARLHGDPRRSYADGLGDGAGIVIFAVVALAMSAALWWFTAWFLLLGQVRWRVLIPTGLITGLAMSGYALAASVWMPQVVTRNQTQYGFFGVALALVTWFSGCGHLHSRGRLRRARPGRRPGAGRCDHPWPQPRSTRRRRPTIPSGTHQRTPAPRCVPTD